MFSAIFDLDNTLTNRADTLERYTAVFVNDFSNELIVEADLRTVTKSLIDLDKGGYGGHHARSAGLDELAIWRQRPGIPLLMEHWQSWVPANSTPVPICTIP